MQRCLALVNKLSCKVSLLDIFLVKLAEPSHLVTNAGFKLDSGPNFVDSFGQFFQTVFKHSHVLSHQH